MLKLKIVMHVEESTSAIQEEEEGEEGTEEEGDSIDKDKSKNRKLCTTFMICTLWISFMICIWTKNKSISNNISTKNNTYNEKHNFKKNSKTQQNKSDAQNRKKSCAFKKITNLVLLK